MKELLRSGHLVWSVDRGLDESLPKCLRNPSRAHLEVKDIFLRLGWDSNTQPHTRYRLVHNTTQRSHHSLSTKGKKLPEWRLENCWKKLTRKPVRHCEHVSRSKWETETSKGTPCRSCRLHSFYSQIILSDIHFIIIFRTNRTNNLIIEGFHQVGCS